MSQPSKGEQDRMKVDDPTWLFPDERNVAVFTSKSILHHRDWVYYVTHDQDDGAWQFHPYSGVVPVNEAVVASLESIVKLDRSLELLADLSVGWHAWRESPDAEWEREPKVQ